MTKARKEQLDTNGGSTGDVIEVDGGGDFQFTQNARSLTETLAAGNSTDGLHIDLTSGSTLISSDGFITINDTLLVIDSILLEESGVPATTATQGAVFVGDGTGGTTANRPYYRPQSSGTIEQLFTDGAGAGATLSQTLENGNITGGTAGSHTIQFSSNDNIELLADGVDFGLYFASPSTIDGAEIAITAQTSSNGDGGLLSLNAGSAGTDGYGGGVQIVTGDGVASGDGGDFTVTVGDGGASGNGGNISITSGIGSGGGADGSITFDIGGASNSGIIDFSKNTTSFVTFNPSTGTSFAAPSSTLSIEELADHSITPFAGNGLIWVRNDAPNVLVFTDDAGVDWDLSGTGVADSLSEVLVNGNTTGINATTSGNDIVLSGGATAQDDIRIGGVSGLDFNIDYTSTASTHGGAVNIFGQNAGTDSNGGAVSIIAGAGNGAGSDGYIDLNLTTGATTTDGLITFSQDGIPFIIYEPTPTGGSIWQVRATNNVGTEFSLFELRSANGLAIGDNTNTQNLIMQSTGTFQVEAVGNTLRFIISSTTVESHVNNIAWDNLVSAPTLTHSTATGAGVTSPEVTIKGQDLTSITGNNSAGSVLVVGGSPTGGTSGDRTAGSVTLRTGTFTDASGTNTPGNIAFDLTNGSDGGTIQFQKDTVPFMTWDPNASVDANIGAAAGNFTIKYEGSVAGIGGNLQFFAQDSSTTDGGNISLTTGSGAGSGTDGSFVIDLITGGASTGIIQLQQDALSFLEFDPETGTTFYSNATLSLEELADHSITPSDGYGLIWVRNDAPNQLIFTDDTGVDWVLGGAGVADTLAEVLATGNTTGTTATTLGNDIIFSGDATGQDSISIDGYDGYNFDISFSNVATNNGGDINITAQEGDINALGGSINIVGGASTSAGTGGNVTLSPGYSIGGTEGDIIFNLESGSNPGATLLQRTGTTRSLWATNLLDIGCITNSPGITSFGDGGSGEGRDFTIESASGVSGNNPGGTLTAQAGTGIGSGKGGLINIIAGTGGATGDGGNIDLTGGTTGNGDSDGGYIQLGGGFVQNGIDGYGGNVTIDGGASELEGGSITLTSGEAGNSDGFGASIILSGVVTQGDLTEAPGNVTISGGSHTGTVDGGNVTISPGDTGSFPGNEGDIIFDMTRAAEDSTSGIIQIQRTGSIRAFIATDLLAQGCVTDAPGITSSGEIGGTGRPFAIESAPGVTGNNPGGLLTVQAGSSVGTGIGGRVNIVGGTGGATGVGGNGGNVDLTGGETGSGDSNGAFVRAGGAFTQNGFDGYGGHATIDGGAGDIEGGNITLTGGEGANVGGSITANTGPFDPGGTAGNIILNLDNATASITGVIDFQQDNISFMEWDPAASLNANIGQDAGDFTLQYAAPPSAGDGYDINILAQDSTGTNTNGGDVRIASGAGGATSGTDGGIYLSVSTGGNTNGNLQLQRDTSTFLTIDPADGSSQFSFVTAVEFSTILFGQFSSSSKSTGATHSLLSQTIETTSGTNTGGALHLYAGDATGPGSTFNTGGAVEILGGTSSGATTNVGGNITIGAGPLAGTNPDGTAGSVLIETGSVSSGGGTVTGGNIELNVNTTNIDTTGTIQFQENDTSFISADPQFVHPVAGTVNALVFEQGGVRGVFGGPLTDASATFIIIGGSESTGGNTGGKVSVLGGNGGTGADGGDVQITGGYADAGAFTGSANLTLGGAEGAGIGGSVSLNASGADSGSGAAGGDITLTAGVGNGVGNNGDIILRVEDGGSGDDPEIRLQLSTSAFVTFDPNAGTTFASNATLSLAELSDHSIADSAGNGLIWVRNDVPNQLIFTDDTGVDWVLGGAGVADALAEVLVNGNTTGTDATTSGNDIIFSGDGSIQDDIRIGGVEGLDFNIEYSSIATTDGSAINITAQTAGTDGYGGSVTISSGAGNGAGGDGYIDLNLAGGIPNGLITFSQDSTPFLTWDPSASVTATFAAEAGDITISQTDKTIVGDGSNFLIYAQKGSANASSNGFGGDLTIRSGSGDFSSFTPKHGNMRVQGRPGTQEIDDTWTGNIKFDIVDATGDAVNTFVEVVAPQDNDGDYSALGGRLMLWQDIYLDFYRNVGGSAGEAFISLANEGIIQTADDGGATVRSIHIAPVASVSPTNFNISFFDTASGGFTDLQDMTKGVYWGNGTAPTADSADGIFAWVDSGTTLNLRGAGAAELNFVGVVSIQDDGTTIYGSTTGNVATIPEGILAIGATPSDAGAIRLENASYVLVRNGADTGNVTILGVDASDNLIIGNGTQVATAHIYASSQIRGNIGGSAVWITRSTELELAAAIKLDWASGTAALSIGGTNWMTGTVALTSVVGTLAIGGSGGTIAGDTGGFEYNVVTGDTHEFFINSTVVETISSSAVTMGSGVSLNFPGAATEGEIRLGTGDSIFTRNQAGADNIRLIGTSGTSIVIGDSDGSVWADTILYAGTGGEIVFRVNGTSDKLTIDANEVELQAGIALDFAGEIGITRQGVAHIETQSDSALALDGYNIHFFGDGTDDTNSMDGGIFIGNAITVPDDDPVGGALWYVEAGASKARGTSGTITTFAAAEPHCPTCGKDAAHEWENEKQGWKLSICMWCMSNGVPIQEAIIEKYGE